VTRILLCTSGGLYGALVLERLLQRHDVEVVGIVRSTRVLHPAYGWLRGALAQLRRSGPAYTLYLGCATTLADLLGRWTGSPSVSVSARRRRIPLLATRDLNCDAGRGFIAGLRPDLLLSAFFNQRIGAAVCALPAVAALNIHPSLLPAYRGVDPVFFARLRGAPRIGVTVHRISESFDTGPVMASREVPVEPGASLLAVTARLFVEGAEALLDALPAILRGEPGRAQPPGGDYDSWPTSAQVGDFLSHGHRLVSLADRSLLRHGTGAPPAGGD
jgi:methionyl-tRNA formyltransferase